MRLLPVLCAVVIALVEVVSMGGLYIPDTTQFLRHTFFVGAITTPGDNVVSPAYPLLLDALCVLVAPPARMFVLVVLQQASVVGGAYLLLRTGEILGRPWAGWAAAWFTALYPPLGFLAQSAYTEPFFVFYCTACAFLSVKGSVSGSPRTLLLAGAMGGLALAQRSTGVALPVAFLVAAALGSYRRKIRSSVYFLIGFAAVVGLFVAKNRVQYGRANLVSAVGIHTFGRFAFVDKWIADTPESRMVLDAAAASGRETIFIENAGWLLSWDLMLKHKITQVEADAILRRVAFQTLVARPFQALGNTVSSMHKMAQRTDLVGDLLWNGLRPEQYRSFCEQCASTWKHWPEAYSAMQEVLPPYAPRATLGRWPFDWIEAWASQALVWRGTRWLIVVALSFLVGVIARDFAVLLFSGLAVGQLAAAALGGMPLHRYFEPSMPAFFMALCLSASCAFDAYRKWSRRRRETLPVEGEAEGGEALPARLKLGRESCGNGPDTVP